VGLSWKNGCADVQFAEKTRVFVSSTILHENVRSGRVVFAAWGPSTAFGWRLTPLKVCDFIDFLHSCHAERKRGAGRGGVEAPQVCSRCHHRRHIFGNARETTGAAIICGVLRLRSASPLYAQDDSVESCAVFFLPRRWNCLKLTSPTGTPSLRPHPSSP
jgi:hypothetical protein